MAMHLNGMESMENGAVDYEEWQPPSEAELKVIQARREHQDKISKLMGDYLLKGYKMLGSTCPYCETILLRTKQGVDYCVACSELDSDATKDDPALKRDRGSTPGAGVSTEGSAVGVGSVGRRQEIGGHFFCQLFGAERRSVDEQLAKVVQSASGDVGAKGSVSVDDVDRPLPQADFATPSIEAQLRGAVDAVLRKLEWATGLLVQTQDIDTRACVSVA